MNGCDEGLSRRGVLGAGGALAIAPFLSLAAGIGSAWAQAGVPASRRLAFEIWRSGARIGRHEVVFSGSAAELGVVTQVQMVVKFGPIPVFHYTHRNAESWRDGRFMGLEARSVSNGRVDLVSARRAGEAVVVRTAKGATVTGPADLAPLSHWNQAVLRGPLFNPQDGKIVHETVTRGAPDAVRLADGAAVQATPYVLKGDAAMTDWYDDQGVWTALKAKGFDGSIVDYRRLA